MNERHLTGAASEMLVAYKFTKAGYTVYYPMLTQSKEDLVVCKDGKFSKVQVKTATTVQTNTGDAKQVRLGGCGRSEYKDGDFDILAVVVDEDVLIFTWDEVKGKTSMCVGRIPGYRARIHWPSFYNVVTGKTLALPNLIALQHIPPDCTSASTACL